MRHEIERKFLVSYDGWKAEVVEAHRFRDGLVLRTDGGKLRVRIEGARASIALKSPRQGLSRLEFEYEIPLADAEAMLQTFSRDNVIEKTRHLVPHAGLTWEVDVYEGVLSGLVLAEVEVLTEDQAIALPDWVGREVTMEPRYRKTALLAAVTGDAGSPA